MRKKIYIAGCGGMLGEAFYNQFKNDYEIKCTDYLFHLGIYTGREL